MLKLSGWVPDRHNAGYGTRSGELFVYALQNREQIGFRRADSNPLSFRRNTTCSRVCTIARNVRHNSFGMGEPRGMLDL